MVFGHHFPKTPSLLRFKQLLYPKNPPLTKTQAKHTGINLDPYSSHAVIDRSQSFDSSLWVQENDNTPLEHTPGNPPGQLWKESLYSLSVKVWGCVPKVCWNNLRLRCWFVKHWAWTLASIQARPGHRILCGGTGGWKGWAMGFFIPKNEGKDYTIPGKKCGALPIGWFYTTKPTYYQKPGGLPNHFGNGLPPKHFPRWRVFFHPTGPANHDPIWRFHIFQMGGENHQLLGGSTQDFCVWLVIVVSLRPLRIGLWGPFQMAIHGL